MSKLYFALVIHNHQPVGNFEYVLEDSYKKSYFPFLEKLFKYPKLKVVLHYSGNLLSWFDDKHPEAIDMIKTLVKDGRAEILSGGFYEPILTSIPETDGIMQIKELTSYIKNRFDYNPKGMWLAERVWEPHLPELLKTAEIEYLPIDDYHFKLAGMDSEQLFGYYITEENGNPLKLFPGNETLRYSIPFKDVNSIIEYFKDVYDKNDFPFLMLADDGEKFGVWPGTYKHCYEDGWLDRFFSALENNSGWMETITLNEYQEKFYPLGKVYLPTASYREMGEWSLPAESVQDYVRIFSEMQRLFGDKAKGLLSGGTWRNFFAKYTESNHIHKKMLCVSDKVHKAASKLNLKKPDDTETANGLMHEIWKGQCNDAYWHGIFGGLYLPHLRSSLYKSLISAQSAAEQILFSDKRNDLIVEEGDIDCDGFKDIYMSRGNLTLFFTEESGALVELSLKDKKINILDILTRRFEAYHSKLSDATINDSHETQTIHESFSAKEGDLQNYLVYDKHRRMSLVDHFFEAGISLDNIIKSEYDERGDFVGFPYNIDKIIEKGISGLKLSRKGFVAGSEINIEKTILLDGSDLRVDYELKGRYNGIFATEFNLCFLGSPNVSIQAGDRLLKIKEKGIHDNIRSFSVVADFLGLKVGFDFDEEINLWHYPVETISLSEQGIEKIYQGTAFLFLKNLDFDNSKKLGFNIKFSEVKL
jgi:hypothetical protein